MVITFIIGGLITAFVFLPFGMIVSTMVYLQARKELN
jgi:uncharacterized membrane protein